MCSRPIGPGGEAERGIGEAAKHPRSETPMRQNCAPVPAKETVTRADLFRRSNLGQAGGVDMRGMVKVFKFRQYDIVSDKFVTSARMATYSCIKRIRAQLLKGSEIEISVSEVNSDGMTEVGFAERAPTPVRGRGTS
jgi:hypothetical protein